MDRMPVLEEVSYSAKHPDIGSEIEKVKTKQSKLPRDTKSPTSSASMPATTENLIDFITFHPDEHVTSSKNVGDALLDLLSGSLPSTSTVTTNEGKLFPLSFTILSWLSKAELVDLKDMHREFNLSLVVSCDLLADPVFFVVLVYFSELFIRRLTNASTWSTDAWDCQVEIEILMRFFRSFCYTVQSSSTGGSNALRDILSLADPPEYSSVSRNSLSSIRSPRVSTTQATSSQSSNLLSLVDSKSTNLVQNTSSLLDDFPDGYHPDSPSKPSQPGSIADPI